MDQWANIMTTTKRQLEICYTKLTFCHPYPAFRALATTPAKPPPHSTPPTTLPIVSCKSPLLAKSIGRDLASSAAHGGGRGWGKRGKGSVLCGSWCAVCDTRSTRHASQHREAVVTRQTDFKRRNSRSAIREEKGTVGEEIAEWREIHQALVESGRSLSWSPSGHTALKRCPCCKMPWASLFTSVKCLISTEACVP